jgi:uncharacterized protein (TIGR03118 family)
MTQAFSTYVSRVGLSLVSLCSLCGCERDKRYLDVVFERVDLAADREGLSDVTDPNLVSPMGLQVAPSGNFWVANNATGTVTVYERDGTPLPASAPLVITLPVPAGQAPETPARVTGVAYYGGSGLEISSGDLRASARFVFVTREGTISGYNPNVDGAAAVMAVDNSATGAVYRGLSVVSLRSGARLYVTNFNAGSVDVFDESFAPASDLDPAAFEDLELPAGYAPFGIQRIDHQLYVSYAEQDAERRDPVRGPGKGYVDAYALDGAFLRRIATEGELNAPWGMTSSPWSFPYFGSALFVGNVGDGRIQAFDPWNGVPLGGLNDTFDQPLVIDGLWDLVFGYGFDGYPALFFTAGPNDGQNGTLGTLLPRFLEVDPPTDP